MMNTEFVSINGTYYPNRESAPWQVRGSLIEATARTAQVFPEPAGRIPPSPWVIDAVANHLGSTIEAERILREKGYGVTDDDYPDGILIPSSGAYVVIYK